MQIYITDKSGKRFWNTDVDALYAQGERKNLNRHLAAIKARHPAYAKIAIDRATAEIIEDSRRTDRPTLPPIGEVEMTDDELLAALTE